MPPPGRDEPVVIRELREGLDNLGQRSSLEIYHDAHHGLAQAQDMYVNGVLSLADRALAEQLYFTTCRQVHQRMQDAASRHHEVLNRLREKLADKVFCNFSVFQSIPDVWAIRQIFPIMPLQQLDQAPERRGVLVDITCDSDGRIDSYVDNEGIESTLPIHDVDPRSPYLLGIFLVGAYQEILGDMHNLFGDTHSVNIELDGNGGYRIVEPRLGDNVDDVLAYVNFDSDTLLTRLRDKIGSAQLDAGLRQQFLEELEAGLSGYTYLED